MKTRGATGAADTVLLPWQALRPWQETNYTLPSHAWSGGHSRDPAVTTRFLGWSPSIPPAE